VGKERNPARYNGNKFTEIDKKGLRGTLYIVADGKWSSEREQTFPEIQRPFQEESGQKELHFRDALCFISQVGNLNLRNWKITALFRAPADGKRKEKTSHFSLLRRHGHRRGSHSFVHGEGHLPFLRERVREASMISSGRTLPPCSCYWHVVSYLLLPL
jgi:hypothetical protein